MFTRAADNAGGVVVLCYAQLCNLEELLRTLEEVLGRDVPFQSLRAYERFAPNGSLGAEAIVQRVLNHGRCCESGQSKQRYNTAHGDDAA